MNRYYRSDSNQQAGKRSVGVFFMLWLSFSLSAQVTSFNFRHLTSTDGLSDGVIHAIAQDKYGFIWIGTSYGLNRFDGIAVKKYFSKASDSGSLTNNFIYSLFLDRSGNLWIGTMTGLCRFDYGRNRFIRYHSMSTTEITDISQDRAGKIWLSTGSGLWVTDETNLSIHKYNPPGNAEEQKKFAFSARQLISAKDGNLYIATSLGIRIFNPQTNSISEIRKESSGNPPLSDNIVCSLAIDSSGHYLWAGCGYNAAILNRIDLKDHSIRQYGHFSDARKKWGGNTISKIIIDREGRLWVISSFSGVSVYNEAKDEFDDYTSNPFVANSLLANSNVAMFQDREGIIWLGTPGYGLSYFNPGRDFFYSILPPFETNNLVAETWCRSVCEDKAGNLWLATAKGLSKLDRAKNEFSIFSNTEGEKPVIQINSTRALLEDDQGDIWIGTARGLNRYHPSTGVMDFFDEKQGMPHTFFWMIVKDKSGTIWLGSAWGLYRYDRRDNHFDDLGKDSLLSKYAHRNIQSLYVDSHNRLWIGLLDIGLLQYDLDKKEERLLTEKDSLISDTRFSSLAEDRNGLIWIGAENGLTVYDPVVRRSHFYTRDNGLPSDRTNNIMVDSFNRVWVGTSNGLCLFNAKRDHIRKFDINDGLQSNQFNEQAAYRTRDGLFIYPTYKGFLVFRPEAYRETNASIPVYITSFRVLDREIDQRPEQLEQLELGHNQNFFSIELSGLDYMNPFACTYAYKLEPFDKDWIYSNKREINYTNVPPGTYTFRYKVVTDNPDQAVPGKTTRISIRQVFYKTWWFRTLLALLLLAGIIAFYRYRLQHRGKILRLQNKAQLLEKEKTLVMYESLKQHLNPHFLFNSLTSLRSLIKSDPKTATVFLDGMSKIYRYVLKSGEQELMPLQDELDFVRTFIELQQIRFGEGLRVHINVEEQAYNKYIVPVTLQNLVENAIKHNTADQESALQIDIFTENDFLVVRNNLQRYRIVESSNKQGLASLRSLYRFYSGKPVGVSEDEKYFTIKIPLL